MSSYVLLVPFQNLEKKDNQSFFAWPVTDNIAPNYSVIISQPMDFSTMRQKIEDVAYTNFHNFCVCLNFLLMVSSYI